MAVRLTLPVRLKLGGKKAREQTFRKLGLVGFRQEKDWVKEEVPSEREMGRIARMARRMREE